MEKVEALLVAGDAASAWRRVGETVAEGFDSPRARDFLLRAVLLAPHYGASERIDSWVEIYRSRRSGPQPVLPGLDDFLRALRLPRLMVSDRAKEIFEAERRIDWRVLANQPVLGHFRFMVLCAAGRFDDAFATLEFLRYREDDTLARVHRLVAEASHHAKRGRLATARELVTQLERLCDGSTSLVLRLLAAPPHARLGRAYYRQGRFQDAEREFRISAELCEPVHATFWPELFAEDLAAVQVALGRPHDAHRTLARYPVPRDWRRHFDAHAIARRLLNRTFVRLELRDARGAQRELERAKIGVRRCPLPFHEAAIYRYRARLAVLRGRRGAESRALALFRRAEELFRSPVFGSPHVLGSTLADRAEVHLRRGEVAEVVACVGESLRIVDDVRDLRLKMRCILLKSYLLLEARYDASREGLYEEILRELGVVENPAVLFEIVANLYMFSWELGDRLDLTAHHLEQIEKLRAVLDADVFHRLYQKHVVMRVTQRALRTVFGVRVERER